MSRHSESSGPTWLTIARSERVVARSLRVSLLVGTVLAEINHGDTLFSATAGVGLIWKIPLTYLVPYAVSTFAAVDATLSS